MGLDMAIRRVSKPRLEEGRVYDFEELRGAGRHLPER